MLLKCSYSDAYVVVRVTISVANTEAADANANNNSTKVIFKHCAPFTNCISEINNTQIDNAKDIGVVMLTHNSNNYSKTLEVHSNIVKMSQL